MHGLAEGLKGKKHLKGKEVSRTLSTAAVAAAVSKHSAADDLKSKVVHSTTSNTLISLSYRSTSTQFTGARLGGALDAH